MDSVKYDNLYEESVRNLHGLVYFVKTLRASHLPSLNTNPRMTLPALFVQQHSDKIRESVELQIGATGRTQWKVRVAVHNPRRLTQVLFYGRGWSDFASSNGLVEGDRLIFVLRGMSTFGVYIYRNGAETAVSGKKAPMERWKSKETSLTSADESRGRKFKEFTVQKIENSVPTASDELTKKRNMADEKVADSASEVWTKVPPDTPRSPSTFLRQGADGDSPLKSCHSSDICTLDQKPLEDLSDDQKLRISLERSGSIWSSIKRKNHHVNEHRHNAPRKKQVSIPSFLKLLTVDNYLHYLEVPCHFTRTWGSACKTHVKLQGIFEGSPERIVACTWGKEKQRLFLTDGWREFQAENDLEPGLVLGFTLTGDSFFVVRGFHL